MAMMRVKVTKRKSASDEIGTKKNRYFGVLVIAMLWPSN